MLEDYRRVWVVGGVVGLVLVLGFLGYLVFGPGPKSQVTFNSIPGDLTLRIDGKVKPANGVTEIREGVHELTAERSGFTTITREIEVKDGEPQAFDIFLDASGPEGRRWLEEHPEAAIEAEGHGSREYENNAERKTAKYPIVAQLPRLTREYRMDYGMSKATPNDPLAVAFYITIHFPEGKEYAREWIRSQGVDPDSLELIYRTS
ncbi:S-layer protein [Kribbella sp. NBC_01245]|uniref:S-layer protein n=1 Tax=Kribbella sp. NBC_01245 TaxID=2903578 RepID=UPI002E28CB0E|nr:S-layer protein [Kribbella sp. NBC_01245]